MVIVRFQRRPTVPLSGKHAEKGKESNWTKPWQESNNGNEKLPAEFLFFIIESGHGSQIREEGAEGDEWKVRGSDLVLNDLNNSVGGVYGGKKTLKKKTATYFVGVLSQVNH